MGIKLIHEYKGTFWTAESCRNSRDDIRGRPSWLWPTPDSDSLKEEEYTLAPLSAVPLIGYPICGISWGTTWWHERYRRAKLVISWSHWEGDGHDKIQPPRGGAQWQSSSCWV